MTKRNLIVMQKWQIVKMVANQTVYILRGESLVLIPIPVKTIIKPLGAKTDPISTSIKAANNSVIKAVPGFFKM